MPVRTGETAGDMSEKTELLTSAASAMMIQQLPTLWLDCPAIKQKNKVTERNISSPNKKAWSFCSMMNMRVIKETS